MLRCGEFWRFRPKEHFVIRLYVRNNMTYTLAYVPVPKLPECQVDRMTQPATGKLIHGELSLDGHKFFVCDEFPASEGGTCKSPEALGGTGVRITLQVDDADSIIGRAVAAGALVSMPVQDMFWGGRYGKIVDPFGHEWGINQQTKEQSHETTQAAAIEFFANRE
jgi:PhnB protein